MENFKNGDDSTGAVKTARFVSINYMNYKTPTTGKTVNQSMHFGNDGVDVGNVKGGNCQQSKACLFCGSNKRISL